MSSGPKVVDSIGRLNVAGYDFELICEIKPQKNPDGTVKEFMPQSKYENIANIYLNKYGKGQGSSRCPRLINI